MYLPITDLLQWVNKGTETTFFLLSVFFFDQFSSGKKDTAIQEMGECNRVHLCIATSLIRVLVVLLALLSSSFAHAQQARLFLPFKHLNAQQGLSQTTNEFIHKDRHGFVWISSIDGLNRFDGRRTKVYRTDTNDPWSIYNANVQSPFFEDDKGDIWFTTDKGINCYRQQRGNFVRRFVRHNGQEYQDRAYTAYHLDREGVFWVSVENSVFLYDTKSDTAHFLLSTKNTAVRGASDLSERYWFGCFWMQKGFDMAEYDPKGRLKRHTKWFEQERQPAPFGLYVRKCVVQSDTQVWFSTSKGLLSFNPNQPDRYRLYQVPDKNPIQFLDICAGPNNTLLTTSPTSSLHFFHTGNKHFASISPSFEAASSQPLIRRQFSYVYWESKDSTIWCSSQGAGILFSKWGKYAFQQPMSLHRNSLLKVSCFFEGNDGDIWCVSERDSTYVFAGKQPNKALKTKTLFPSRTQLWADRNTCWSVSRAGIGSLDISAKKLMPVMSNQAENMTSVARLDKNSLLIGTFSGLFIFKKDQIRLEKVLMLDSKVNFLYVDEEDGYVWVGTETNLLVYSKMSGWKAPAHSWAIEKTMHISKDSRKRCIWAATSNGLLKIWQDPDNTWRDSLLTERDGLPNQYIYAVVPDKKDNLWLSSNQGIIKYMPDQPKGEQFKHFTTRNGLSSNEYSPGAALMSSTGEIWFGSTRGVDVFHPDSVRDIGTAPQLAIVGLKIHDTEWRSDTVCIEMAQRISLNYNENTLRLELAAMEYTDPEMNRFRVWLSKDGGKPDTVELGTQNFITYANLRHGKYRFGFTACNSEGIWQKTPRYLEIAILPHFSDTLWFKVLMAVLALAVIGFSTAFYYRYRLRVQQLEIERQQREADRKQLLLENELALQQERNRIADEMHDELGGGLSTIRLASERSRKMDSPDELKNILGRVSQISIGLISNMRGIIWAMDTQNDSLDSLLSYLRQYARTFLDDNQIAANIQMPAERPDISLTGQYRHSILLTVKECLNNILKHAEATEVWLHTAVGEQLIIHIRDNGKGFDPEEKAGSGKGLRTTVKRMESIGGNIEWIQNEEGGMTTVLRAPLSI